MAHSECPPLGTGSVDFDALHKAAMKGEDLVKAVEAATTRVEPPAEPAPAPEPDKDAGKAKA